MAEILLRDAKCEECGKSLPQLSLAVVVSANPVFVVCIECNEKVEEDWRYFLEHMDEILNG